MDVERLSDWVSRRQAEWGVVDNHGLLRTPLVDIDQIAEATLGLQIVGSSRDKDLKLPKRKLACLQVFKRRVVMSPKLLNSASSESKYRFVLAHEVAHFLLHREIADQFLLPFDDSDHMILHTGELCFGPKRQTMEREAHVLAALLLMPIREICRVIGPVVERYFSDDWTRYTSCVEQAERKAAKRYREEVRKGLSQRFGLPEWGANVALEYFGIELRPSREWQRICREAR